MRVPLDLPIHAATLAACPLTPARAASPATPAGPLTPIPELVTAGLAKYTTIRLQADSGSLSARERQMLPILVEAARQMDAVYWQQVYGDRAALLAAIADPQARRFA